jgi:hypothetical protein
MSMKTPDNSRTDAADQANRRGPRPPRQVVIDISTPVLREMLARKLADNIYTVIWQTDWSPKDAPGYNTMYIVFLDQLERLAGLPGRGYRPWLFL